MNYEEITAVTAELINDYMKSAIKTDNTGVAEMFVNASWGAYTLWAELCKKNASDIRKKNPYAPYDLEDKFEKQLAEFIKMTDRVQVPLLK